MPEQSSAPEYPAPNGKPSFEESLEALHQIVAQLEMGALPLDETIERFKEGSRLAAECLRQIEEAELRVTTLAMESAVGIAQPPHSDE